MDAKRVHYATLSRHIGERVRFVGEFVNSTGDGLTLRSTDNNHVEVILSGGDPGRLQAKWIEVTGEVQRDLSIREEFSVPLPGEVDREAWNQLVDLIHRYPHTIF
jgi:hypothetical protein